MFLRKIIPQDKVYFELFRELGEAVREAGQAVTRLAKGDCLVAAAAEELKKIEHRADDVSHELLRRMESTFVTPFDREDIHLLADRLDEVVDTTEEVACLAAVYQIERLNGSTGQMAQILGQTCSQVADAVAALPAMAPVLEVAKAVKTSETAGDALYYAALSDLFESGVEPLEVIKWKDIVDQLETAIDACESVAGTLEGIALKHG